MTAAEKRLIIITSTKGGAGKSIFARILAEFHREFIPRDELPTLLIDGAGGSGQLIQTLGERDADGGFTFPQTLNGVLPIDFMQSERERDALFNTVADTNATNIIIDLPAQSLAALEREEISLLKLAEEKGFKVTVVSLINGRRATMRDAHMALALAPNADHVWVQNHYFDDERAQETRARIVAAYDEAREQKYAVSLIDMGRLHPTIDFKLDQANRTYHDCMDAKYDTLTSLERTRLVDWVCAMMDELRLVRPLVGGVP